MSRAQFVFESVGTRGDIEPLLGVAARLRALGHECALIAPLAFQPEAEALGLRFFASTERREATSGAKDVQIPDFYFPAYEAVAAALRELAEAELPTLVINIDRSCASNLLAERLGLPVVRLILCPFKIRSLVEPPWPWGEHARGPVGKIYLKHTYPRLLRAADHAPRLLDYINGRRRSLDLLPITSAFHPEPQVCSEVALFPDWFAAPASDWPEQLRLAGFPESKSAATLPARVQEFLSREPRPIVFTTGTGERNVEAFFRAARECCAQLGRAGIFLSSLEPADTAGNHRLLADGHAELSALLPLASAFVHHGGIGGTARALAAGIPQVVSPIRFDQPDNARRVRELGVGAVVPRESLTGAALAAALAELESSPEAAAAIRRVRDLASLQRGTEQCAELLLDRGLPAALSAYARRLTAAQTWQAAAGSSLASSAAVERRTIVLLVWPEPGHIASPLALARQLRSRGDRVIFAGLDMIRSKIVTQGFEFVTLASLSPSARGLPTSLLWSWAGEEPLAPAFEELSARVDALLEDARPDLVLIDSLYSVLGGLIERRAPWAIYETDLPREADPLVPPPHLNLVPSQTQETRAELRSAWNLLLRETARRRAVAPPARGGWSLRTRFPDQLCRLIQAKRGLRPRLHRNAAVAPVARGRRLIFCPQSFDFERSRTADFAWGDPCIDIERSEPPFDWGLLPPGKPLIYCAQGTQSARDGTAISVLQSVLGWIRERQDLAMILTCSANQLLLVSEAAPPNCFVVDRAPQLAVLRRASAAIVHAGFNTVKECVAHGVPMLAVPLSHDQPRNAALVQARGIGLSADPATLTAAELEHAMSRLLTEPGFRVAAQRFRSEFERSAGSTLSVIDRWLSRSVQSATVHGG